MNNASYVGLSLQVVLQRELDSIATNVANANTTGFQAQRPMFSEFLGRVGQDDRVSYVLDRASLVDTEPGPLVTTGNPLDVAIVGDGYFVVETDRGFRYTRAGSFQLNAEGQVVTANGDAVMGDGNSPLFIAPGETRITVASDGTLATENGPIGRIAVVNFANPQALRRIGDTLYEADETPEPAEAPRLAQGAVENSNVRAVLELTRLIEVSRTYQQMQQLIESEYDIGRKAMTALAGQI